jgi:hypothetical protein
MPETFKLDLDPNILKKEIDTELQEAANDHAKVESLLAQRSPSASRGEVEPSFWENVRTEFRKFLCTKNRRYAKVREAFKEQGRKATPVLVGLLTGAIAGAVGSGLLVGVLVPFVALLLYTVATLGVAAYCKAPA